MKKHDLTYRGGPTGRRPATDIEELLQAALLARPDRRAQALRVLLGEEELPQAVAAMPAGLPEPYLTLKEVAARLNLSASSLWRWRVPSYDLGGRPKYRLAQVEAYLSSDTFRRRTAALRAERREQTSARKSARADLPVPNAANP